MHNYIDVLIVRLPKIVINPYYNAKQESNNDMKLKRLVCISKSLGYLNVFDLECIKRKYLNGWINKNVK